MFKSKYVYMAEDGEASSGGEAVVAEKAAVDKVIDKVAVDKVATEKVVDDGKRKVSDEEAALLKEVMKKKDALDKSNTELATVKEQLKKFEGLDAEAARALLKEKEALEQTKLEQKGEWDSLKKQMAEAHGKEIEALKAIAAANESALEKSTASINELTVGTAFAQSKLITEELTLTPNKARLIYGSHFDLVDGIVVGFDKPRGSANRTVIVNQYGNNVDFDEAMRKIVDADPERDELYKSKAKSGSNSDSTKIKGKVDLSLDGMSGLEKIASGLKGLPKGT